MTPCILSHQNASILPDYRLIRQCHFVWQPSLFTKPYLDRIDPFLVGCELVEAGGLAVVFWQVATAVFVEERKLALRDCVPLVGCELVEARGLTVVFWQTTTAFS